MLRIFLSVLLSFAACVAIADTERGWFGFASSVKAEGAFWNPTLVSITIEDVTPGSPAAAQGFAKGDQVLELEGQPIAGRKGTEVQAVMKSKAPGDKLVARLKRANGEVYLATLIAMKKPEQ